MMVPSKQSKVLSLSLHSLLLSFRLLTDRREQDFCRDRELKQLWPERHEQRPERGGPLQKRRFESGLGCFFHFCESVKKRGGVAPTLSSPFPLSFSSPPTHT